MRKLVFYCERMDKSVSVLKYKVVYENKEYCVLATGGSATVHVIRRKDIYSLNDDAGKLQLAQLLTGKSSTWGRYFDGNPLLVSQDTIIETQRLKARQSLVDEIRRTEEYAKDYADKVEQKKERLIKLEQELVAFDNIPMEIINDSEDL